MKMKLGTIIAALALSSCTVTIDPATGRPRLGVDGDELTRIINERIQDQIGNVNNEK